MITMFLQYVLCVRVRTKVTFIAETVIVKSRKTPIMPWVVVHTVVLSEYKLNWSVSSQIMILNFRKGFAIAARPVHGFRRHYVS